LSFAQVDDITNIFDLPLGLSLEVVEEKWEQNNLNDYTSLISKLDDALKYEVISDSLELGCIFYFVDDSLYTFSFWAKLTSIKTQKLLDTLNDKFGKADSTIIEKFGNVNEGNLKEYPSIYWSRKNDNNNSIDKISISHGPISEDLIIFNFFKYNTSLGEKARLQHKHQIKI
jgi:hypothetical protein